MIAHIPQAADSAALWIVTVIPAIGLIATIIVLLTAYRRGRTIPPEGVIRPEDERRHRCGRNSRRQSR